MNPNVSDNELIEILKRRAFEYFRDQWNPVNGLIADKNKPGTPASIAVLGMGLSVYTVAVECALLTRAEAVERTLKALRFLQTSEQSANHDATGCRGFYYHFLDMESGKRAWKSELSTVDTAILMAGVLTARNYFTGENSEERELREIADFLYQRVEWNWALNGAVTLTHGWKPERGFLRYRWNKDYSEAMILYTLALGSPTHAIDPAGYLEWISSFETQTIYGIETLHAGPLFIHQMSHLWIDFRGIRDQFCRKVGFDYFENSKRATQIQQQYAIQNPRKFINYGKYFWGLTASDGPGKAVRTVNGVKRYFYDYRARGVPHGPDDGTVSPWAVVASLPFAPDIVLDTIRNLITQLGDTHMCEYGFDASYNSSFTTRGKESEWHSPWIFGLNQGALILMIENYQTGLIWKTFNEISYVKIGLEAAGFASAVKK
ncbi:MAG: hypothetical protein IAF58_09940 [Leptolyngbya sp.]|nr:hypothetical protein [Candidatus Melainabacteria bacterium]